MRCAWAVGAILASLAAAPAWAADAHVHGSADAAGAIGASVDELIAEARRMNPDLAVAALEAQAAAAKAEGAGSLADPTIQLKLEDVPGASGYPTAGPKTQKLILQQDLPFWGKRDLRRDIAQADSRKAAAARAAVENELAFRVKVAYAEYHQAHLAMDLVNEVLPRLETIAKLASARYGQGLGRQQDATAAEVERTTLALELVRLEAERRKARARLNALLNRGPEAALVETPHPRALPPAHTLDPAVLAERAQHANPELDAETARIDAADQGAKLAEKSWYPDLGVGVGAVRRNGQFDGYEAMVQINIPLQTGLRRADIGETQAMAQAARSRWRAKLVAIDADLRNACWGLEAAIRSEKMLVESALPQARIGFEGAARAYEQGQGDFLTVLTAEQQWRRIHVEHLKMQLEQQTRLAEVEKMIGGEL